MKNISRRDWMTTVTGTALYPALAGEPPNVVLILTDDQGYGDLGIHGNPYLKTPNLDKLASQGVELTRFYVSPVCAPTRSALLTGRYNLRCGVYGVTEGRETMRTEETTIAEALRGAGYRTGLFGKWHLGEHYPYVPHAQGFDEFVGFRTGHWTNYFDTMLERNGKPLQTKGYITDFFTDESIRFMERNQDRPFFLYAAYNAPHAPFQVPERYLAPYKSMSIPEQVAAVYAMVANLDENVGRLLAALERLRLAQNTIVVFLTDNGPNGQRYNAGLRAAKGSVYEGGVRVPFFIRWPGRLQAGRRVDTIAAHIDLYPTLLEMCGASMPKGLPIDGRSILPLLEGKAQNWPDRMLFTHREGKDNPSSTYPGAVRTERFNLVNGKELYEIPADPGEQNNVAVKYPQKVKELRAAYEAWYEVAGRECGFVRKPIPVGYAEENPVSLPAPQSYFHGDLKFFAGSGFAHDWITNWKKVDDWVHWDVDVVHAGRCEVTLSYLCPKEDLGSRIAVSVGEARVEAAIAEPTSMTPKPARDVIPRSETREMHWGSLPLGTLTLPAGKSQLAVRALTRAGGAVMDLKSVSLRRL
jgi:arylsulfatase A